MIGSAELTDDEIQKVRTFVDRHTAEHESLLQLTGPRLLRAMPRMYCVYPHAAAVLEADGRYARTRFSCAGFVFEAYRKAGIALLDLKGVPPVDIATTRAAYPRQAELIEAGRISWADVGLEGDGPWPVMLCGYLLHALHRDAPSIRATPHTPTADQRFFTG